MKKIWIYVLLMIGSFGVQGQNYVRLFDATGMNPTQEEMDSLEAAATALVNVLPTEFQADFKVFDVGFYLHNADMAGGVNAVWDKMVAQANNQSRYYLLFGREMGEDNSSKVYINLELPRTGKFECIEIISPTFREGIVNEITLRANAIKDDLSLFQNEKNAVDFLNKIVNNKLCCDGRTSCDDCLAFDYTYIDGKIYYPIKSIHETLVQKEFLLETVLITSDQEYAIPGDNPTLNGDQSEGSRNSILTFDASIQFQDGNQTDLDALSATLLNDLSTDGSLTIYKFKYPRDCGQFEKIWNDYLNDDGNAIFIALINVDRINGILGYQMKVESGANLNNRSDPDLRISGTDPTEEDLEGIREVREESGKACSDLLYAYLVRFDYHGDEFLADVILSKEEREYYNEYYQRKNTVTSSQLNQASITFGYYYSKEWWVQKKLNNRWDWTASIVSHYNICNETIHGFLDYCGVIEGIGSGCDLVNAVFYGLEGNGKDCTLSAFGAIPVLGEVANGVKIARRIKKFESVTQSLTFSYKKLGGSVHFVGGAAKLKKEMKKLNFSSNFAGITRYVNDIGVEIHHLIPTELFKAGPDQLAIFKKMAKMGWHAGDPFLNGIVIPKYCKNGTKLLEEGEEVIELGEIVFHANHPKYTEWVKDALSKIDGISGDDVLVNISKLEDHIVHHLEKAYNANKSINEYFRELIEHDEWLKISEL